MGVGVGRRPGVAVGAGAPAAGGGVGDACAAGIGGDVEVGLGLVVSATPGASSSAHEAATRAALEVMEGLGATVEETSLPHTPYALAVYYIIAPSEASANLARYDGVKYGYSDKEAASMWDSLERTRHQGFGPEVKRRIMLGTYALSAGYYDAYYLKAQKVRTLIRKELDEAFQQFDALVMPTSPSLPEVRICSSMTSSGPSVMNASMICAEGMNDSSDSRSHHPPFLS